MTMLVELLTTMLVELLFQIGNRSKETFISECIILCKLFFLLVS